MPEQPLTRVIEFDPEDEYRPEPEPEAGPPAWMDGTLRIGIHTSIAGGYLNALESAHKLGCNALQIFSASPRMWASGPSRVGEVDAAAFRARREALGLGPLVIHANYLINLAFMTSWFEGSRWGPILWSCIPALAANANRIRPCGSPSNPLSKLPRTCRQLRCAF